MKTMKLNQNVVKVMLNQLETLRMDVSKQLAANPNDKQLKTYEEALDKVSCILNASGVAGEAN